MVGYANHIAYSLRKGLSSTRTRYVNAFSAERDYQFTNVVAGDELGTERAFVHFIVFDKYLSLCVGTWLGITRQGRIAVLTNYREASSAAAIGTRSRGAMVNAFLTSPADRNESTRAWVQKMLTAEGDEGTKGVGGFSLLCGTIRPRQDHPGALLSKPIDLDPLAIISNRTPSKEEAHWICSQHNEVHGLSNSLFDDPMPKVTLGESLLRRTIDEAISSHITENELTEKLFSVLAHDTLPVTKAEHTYETDLESLCHSIFIPAFETHEEKSTQPKPAEPAITPTPDTTSTPNGMNINGTTNGISSAPRYSGKIIAPRPANGAEPDCFCTTPATPASISTPSDSPRTYGTQKQTLILVSNEGHVKFIERTLYDEDARWVQNKDERDTVFEFDIEGWS